MRIKFFDKTRFFNKSFIIKNCDFDSLKSIFDKKDNDLYGNVERDN